MFHLAQDMGADVWTEGIGSNQFDVAAKEFFEKKGKLHEVIEGVFFGHEFHEDIDIAQGRLFIPNKRAEEPDIPHAEKNELVSRRLNTTDYNLPMICLFVHGQPAPLNTSFKEYNIYPWDAIKSVWASKFIFSSVNSEAL